MATKDKYPKVTPVIVRWIDSTGSPGWGKFTPSDMECTSVGHLVMKDNDRICLALNRSKYMDGDHMEIPMAVVKSVKRLRE